MVKTYTVTKEITVRVNDTSAVSITKNGENVRFDEHSSGVGTITIQGTNPNAATADAADESSSTNDAKSTTTGSAKKNSSDASSKSSSNNN